MHLNTLEIEQIRQKRERLCELDDRKTNDSGGTGQRTKIFFFFLSEETLYRNYQTPLEKPTWGFPGGTVVKSLPANAGDTGSSPGLGRSRMPQSDWARQPQLLSLRVWSLCSATREAETVRGPRTAIDRKSVV